MDKINFDEFKKIEIKIGKILSAEKIENAEKLLRLKVFFGDETGERQIVSGIAQYYEVSKLVGKKLPFIVNLEPRKFRGVESQGMLMAVAGEKPILLVPEEDVKEGSEIV